MIFEVFSKFRVVGWFFCYETNIKKERKHYFTSFYFLVEWFYLTSFYYFFKSAKLTRNPQNFDPCTSLVSIFFEIQKKLLKLLNFLSLSNCCQHQPSRARSDYPLTRSLRKKLRISVDSSLIRLKLGTFLYKMIWIKVS